MQRVVVGVGRRDVVVVVVVVFVTSSVVVTVFWVVVVVVVLELAEDADDDDEEDEEVCEELDVLDSDTGSALVVGTADVVSFVATCSSRTGGRVSVRLLVTPTANKAATAAPRNAPTAMRNGAPLWSSTRYLYRVNPFGSSQVE